MVQVPLSPLPHRVINPRYDTTRRSLMDDLVNVRGIGSPPAGGTTQATNQGPQQQRGNGGMRRTGNGEDPIRRTLF